MVRGGVIIAAGLALCLSACTKRVDEGAGPGGDGKGRGGGSAAPVVDVTPDRAVVKQSWLLALARDSAPLSTLARSSGGWPLFFRGDPRAAFDAFSADARSENLDAHIGAARAALALAEAEASLGRTQLALTAPWLKAQSTRPEAAKTAPWRALVEARLLARTGADASALLKTVGEGGEAGAIAAALLASDGDAAAALTGRAAPDGDLPPAVSPALKSRLAALAAAGAGDAKGALRALEAAAVEAADFVVTGDAPEGNIALRDPWVAGFAAKVWARLAEQAVKDVAGWPTLVRARALLIVGEADQAAQLLEGLVTGHGALPAPPLSLMVLGGALDAADLLAETQALLVGTWVGLGRKADAERIAQSMATDTVTRRVWHAYAQAALAARFPTDAFPQDRDVFGKAIDSELQALGPAAPGMADVTALLLVERTVDAVQRAFAEAAVRGGDGALAVKHREAAEDKLAAMAPSARNTIQSLAAAADDNVAIGRPRVALKYYSRMRDRLPAVAVPSEMLRDLLSLQAMEHDGSATAGQ